MKKTLLIATLFATSVACAKGGGLTSAGDYESIQAALDANPGAVVYVPPGRYELAKTLSINTPGAGLSGPGVIVQTSANDSVVRIEADGVRVSDVTLTRTESGYNGAQEGIVAVNASNVVIEGIRVLENRSKGPAISLRNSNNGTVRNCFVENYKCITIEDRTADPMSGYAFRCIDGTGISATGSGSMIIGNRVVESHLLPTEAVKEKYKLGELTKKNKERGTSTKDSLWDSNYTNNWHQGSGIIVSALGRSRTTILTGNYIQNPAQGIDLHTDNVIVSNNIIESAMMGMKAIHGSTNTLVEGNQFVGVDLQGVLFGPGTASHAIRRPADFPEDYAANGDGGSLMANNITTDFGLAGQKWNWKGRGGSAYVVQRGALETNPPIHDVLVYGNIAYDPGRDGVIVDGEPTTAAPEYTYAFSQALEGPAIPVDVKVTDNLFNPGTRGILNTDPTK